MSHPFLSPAACAAPTTPASHRYSPRSGTHLKKLICHTDGTGVGSTLLATSVSPRTPSTPSSLGTDAEGRRTPYTPFSVRSFASSFTSPSAQQETIDSGAKQSPSQHRAPFHPSNNQQSYTIKSKHVSLADQIDNWRTRAQLNGIKVTSDEEENQHQSAVPRHRLPACFSTPPPKRNVESIYVRGAYTAPTRLSFHESPLIETSYSNLASPFAANSTQEQTLLSPLRQLNKLIKLSDSQTLSRTEASLSAASFSNTPASTPGFNSVLIPSPFTPDVPAKSSCAVCDKEPSQSFRMIVLSPCSHIFCSSCFTGTLNIVGEKNMSCMECQTPVQSFHFALNLDKNGSPARAVTANPRLSPHFCDELASQLADLTASAKKLPEKLADVVPSPDTITTLSEKSLKTGSDISILRLDNIPWDVTPAMLQEFFKLPLLFTHILLDPKGKTLSHAFVRLTTSDARTALRLTQNAILGKGRRARAVTVTLSNLDELMAAMYPCWKGTFKNGAPSLDGLDTERVKDALSHGLVSTGELNALRELILNPDSPFLKAPGLPFSSLMNILVTFPSDVDSQMFWNLEIQDMLYEVTMVAVKISGERALEANAGLDLLLELRDAVTDCRIFTDLQKLILLQAMKDSMGHGRLDV